MTVTDCDGSRLKIMISDAPFHFSLLLTQCLKEKTGKAFQPHLSYIQALDMVYIYNFWHNLNILRACSTAVRNWYLSNNLLLNADKSDVVVLGTEK